MTDTVPLPQVVGNNARDLRLSAGARLQDIATSARKFGLRWSTGKVGDLEAGRVAPTLPNLIALALALSDHVAEGVSLADLVRTERRIKVNDELAVDGELLVGLLSEARPPKPEALSTRLLTHEGNDVLPGDPVPSRVRSRWPDLSADDYVSVRLGRTDVEARLAKELDTTPDTLDGASARLWRRTYLDERERRAGPEANAQKRGHIGRQLREELRGELARGDS